MRTSSALPELLAQSRCQERPSRAGGGAAPLRSPSRRRARAGAGARARPAPSRRRAEPARPLLTTSSSGSLEFADVHDRGLTTDSPPATERAAACVAEPAPGDVVLIAGDVGPARRPSCAAPARARRDRARHEPVVHDRAALRGPGAGVAHRPLPARHSRARTRGCWPTTSTPTGRRSSSGRGAASRRSSPSGWSCGLSLAPGRRPAADRGRRGRGDCSSAIRASRSADDADRLRHLDGDRRPPASARGRASVRTAPPSPERLLGPARHSAELLPALAGLLERGGSRLGGRRVDRGRRRARHLHRAADRDRDRARPGAGARRRRAPVSSLAALAAGVAAGARLRRARRCCR